MAAGIALMLLVRVVWLGVSVGRTCGIEWSCWLLLVWVLVEGSGLGCLSRVAAVGVGR